MFWRAAEMFEESVKHFKFVVDGLLDRWLRIGNSGGGRWSARTNRQGNGMQVRQANLLISMLILASCGQLGTLCSLHSEQSTPSHLSMRATLQRLRGGAEPGFLQLHCENGTKKVVGEQEAPGWEGQQNPTDAGLSAMEKLQRVLARRAAHLQNATAASARASSKRSVGTESDASTDLENSSASSEEELKGAASVPVSVDKLRDDVEGEGVGEEGERSREPVHSLEELMGQIDQEKRRKAVANARAAVEQVLLHSSDSVSTQQLSHLPASRCLLRLQPWRRASSCVLSKPIILRRPRLVFLVLLLMLLDLW